ncbi:MAG: hypothetical protein LLG20_04140 [Acidobacteriales bacterium]|nr:hypothetical protein [Terriglobales bacterium]
MQNFWAKVKLACMTGVADRTNEDIWASSAVIHQQLGFHPGLFVAPGSVGPQQAMLDPAIHPWLPPNCVAPWVPDLLGEEWTHPNAVLVVGSALAGFIGGYSRRDQVMELSDYFAAQTWQAFQRVFFRDVVSGDEDYYERLCPLLNHPRRFACFDLVRCSLVVRAAATAHRRRDENINTRWPDHRAVFARYAEHPKSKQWATARLLDSHARLIIALGFTAEYGLVRLVADLGMRVRDSQTGLLWQERRLREPGNWTYGYPGGSGRSLASRYTPPCWWQVEDPATGSPRWAIVPLVHPSSWGSDPGYRKSRSLIAAARRAIRRW